MIMKKKVAVAMSGGVDSSVTAALLQERGFEVIGITMYLHEEDGGAAAAKAVEDAKKVADILGIEHYVADFRQLFKENVIDYFLRTYKKGQTPNPCVVCNQKIKFGALWQRARELGAEYIATGHYAKVCRDEATGEYFLAKGADDHKDQTYALYHIEKEVLAHLILPLGSMEKTETRALAEKYNLPVAQKAESQDVCFIPNDNYKAFLKRKAGKILRRGKIVDSSGQEVGRHEGVALYTVGQRKGLGVAAGRPLYVQRLDAAKNQVVVGSNEELFTHGLVADDVNFHLADIPRNSFEVMAKIRYGAKASLATVTMQADGTVKVVFAEKQRAVTPGQSVVFYQGDRLVGGGVIVRALTAG